jgi:hypothetical protein
MIHAQRISVAKRTLIAHQGALAALTLAHTSAEVADGLGKLATLQREVAGHAREFTIHVTEYSCLGPRTDLLDMVQEDADQIARGSDLIAGILDQMRQRVLTGSWSIPEVSDVVQVQAQLGGVHIEQLGTLLDRLRIIDAHCSQA